MAITVQLQLHPYRYFAYERDLARRELVSLGAQRVHFSGNNCSADFVNDLRSEKLNGLTYFKSYFIPTRGEGPVTTLQHRLELSYHNDVDRKRQQTRYSAHCWHEYKGRFNPQIVHGILNCFFERTTSVLDPFCGSGTTLVECAHKGVSALGVDINPFSVFLSSAKINALHARPSDLRRSAVIIARATPRDVSQNRRPDELTYLKKWFPSETLREIEGLRHAALTQIPRTHQSAFLCLMSDLLREYSLQEPSDLRIRRRFSEFPKTPFREALAEKINKCLDSLENTRKVVGTLTSKQVVRLGTAEEPHLLGRKRFDGVVTSPPYATALPYVDTQRLSLVWLGLVSPNMLAETEESLIGAREVERKAQLTLQKKLWDEINGLPNEVNELIRKIARAHGGDDGFRKRAVPALLFRYFTRMKVSLLAMRNSVRSGGKAVLVVGTNHTTAGEIPFQIPTPYLLALIGETVGWNIQELVPLQAYHRYGLHSKNAVQGEALVVLH